MRVQLKQDEIFEAIADFVRSKWKLDNTTTLEIDITAGRTPKGYTADIEIIEQKSEPVVRCVAAPQTADLAAEAIAADPSAAFPAVSVTSQDPTSFGATDGYADPTDIGAAVASADDIFNS